MQYENLYAPFDFSIKKNSEEITREQNEVKKRQDRYFRYNNSVKDEVYNSYNDVFDNVFKPETYDENTLNLFRSAGTVILDRLYDPGILMKSDVPNSGGQDYLIVENEARPIDKKGLLRMPNVDDVIFDVLEDQQMSDFKDQFQELFFEIVKPNVFFDAELTERALNDELSKISHTRGGTVDEGKLIIAKGEVVETSNLEILNSLKGEYESELWTENNQYYILFGYTILVALVLVMLLLFLKKYRPEIFDHNTKVTFIFFNILFMVFITTLVVKYDESYVFVVPPLCILPLILKTFLMPVWLVRTCSDHISFGFCSAQ